MAKKASVDALFVGRVRAQSEQEETLVAVRYITTPVTGAQNRTPLPKAVILMRPFSVVQPGGRAVTIETADIELFSSFKEGDDEERENEPPIEIHEGDTVALYAVGGAPLTSMGASPGTPVVLLKSWS